MISRIIKYGSGVKRMIMLRTYHKLFTISDEVQNALKEKSPIVALESTIITHGMPYPQNLDTASTVEDIIRSKGATPATIGILGGEILIGLSKAQLAHLADSNTKCVKVSRRDLSYVVSQKLNGGTTVSGTMLLAHRAGIPVFVTGGIGGVHRQGESSLDISADLTELGRTPVAVVCSGVKSILDIARTLEYLETQGVTVISYAKSNIFPSFYCSRSKFVAACYMDAPLDVAKLLEVTLSLQLQSGVLIAVPIPDEHSMDETEMERVIEEGLEAASRENIHGKEVTPFLLKKMSDLTGGQSLQSSILTHD